MLEIVFALKKNRNNGKNKNNETCSDMKKYKYS